jgi:HipA-like protein
MEIRVYRVAHAGKEALMLAALKRAVLGTRRGGGGVIETPAGERATFVLEYRDLEVGTLQLKDQAWTFQYSGAFRSQSEVQPLISFPDVRKLYQATRLWPFFACRIPSAAQRQVREAIEKEGLNVHSDVDMLRRFGTRSISNPFVLRSM